MSSLVDAWQVTGEAQGDEASLEKFLGDLSKGPSLAEVEKVEKKEISTEQNESFFDVR